MKYLAGGSAVLFGTAMLTVILAIAMFGAQGNCGSGSASVSPPGADVKTGAQIVRYLETQGLTAIAAAGIEGNLDQESGLNPQESGGGLAQWNPSWYTTMASFATSHGLSPSSIAGQLAYLAYDLHTAYKWLLDKLNTATDPGTAATMFETGYEICSGVTGFMQVTAGSLCMDSNRRLFAAMALSQSGGTAASLPVSLATSGPSCAEAATVNAAGYANPFAHTQTPAPNRIDMGVDYDGTGEIDSLGLAKITYAGTGIGGGWTCATGINGGLVYELLNGAYAGKYIYLAEDITPTTHPPQIVQAGQQIGNFPPHGCIEMGWEVPSTGASGAGVQPLATTIPGFGGDQSPGALAAGDSINRLLKSTGAAPGFRSGAGVGVTASPAPAGYP